jgi:glycerol-3-phosphate acyltransferase PlsY
MIASTVWRTIAAVVIGYLLGSIPWGVIIGRCFAKVDVRDYGSGKMGTTNVLRVAGKKAAVLVAFLDVLKGALAVGICWFMLRGEYNVSIHSFEWWLLRTAPVVAALAAVAGHNWPIFLKFRGGRGVATFYGGLVALCPPVALVTGLVAVLGASLTKFVSLASIVGAVTAYVILVPLTIVNHFPIEYLLYALMGAITIILTHRDNIGRLLNGQERRLGERVEVTRIPSGKMGMR